MRKVRRLQALVVGVCMLLGLVGCGTEGQESASVQRYGWPLGTASPEDTVTQIYAEKFAAEVEALSDGKIKIQVYPNSTLGGDRELLESCKDGAIPFVIQNTAPQVSFMPDLSVFDMPCLFDTIEDARAAVDDKQFYSLAEEVYQKGGYTLLGYADQGFRVVSTNKKVESFDDFRGQKIRTMENTYHVEFWKALKASPTPMTFSEVYIGLQQGTIDAQENPYEVIVSNRLYEQQDYIIETNHLPHLISLIVSEDFFEGLTEKEQDIMREAAERAKEEARREADARNANKIAQIESSGTKIITLNEQIVAEMREASAPVYEEIRRVADEKIVDAYLKK